MMSYLAGVVTLAYDPAKCTGCGLCAEVCPHGVFVMEPAREGAPGAVAEGRATQVRARLTDRDLCIECGACQANCRFGAIRVTSGVGCASAIIGGALRGTEPTCGCCGPDGAAPRGGGCCT